MKVKKFEKSDKVKHHSPHMKYDNRKLSTPTTTTIDHTVNFRKHVSSPSHMRPNSYVSVSEMSASPSKQRLLSKMISSDRPMVSQWNRSGLLC